MSLLNTTCCFSPDFEALEETVGVFGLVRLLTDDGAKPPGVIDHRAKPVVCTGRMESISSKKVAEENRDSCGATQRFNFIHQSRF